MAYSTHALPRLAAIGNTFQLGWVEAIDGGPEVHYYIAASSDGGKTFSPPESMHGKDASRPGFTALSASADGSILASWLDGRNGHPQPFFARRGAGSAGFEREKLVFAGPEGKGVCPCCDMAAVRLPDGSNLVAFRNTDAGHRDIWFARAPSGGAFGPVQALSLDNWTYQGCPHDAPALAVHGSQVFAVWMSGHSGRNRVYAANSSTDDLVFNSRELSPGTPGAQGHPKLATTAAGQVYAVWDESLGNSPPPAAETGHSKEHGHGHSLVGDGRAVMLAVTSHADGQLSLRDGGFAATGCLSAQPGHRDRRRWGIPHRLERDRHDRQAGGRGAPSAGPGVASMTSQDNLENRRKPARPAAVAAIGAVSLIVFAAAGWSLGRMRSTAIPPLPTDTIARTATEPKSIARGRLVYQVHCARCHGPSGHGDGSDAPLLKTAPRDLATVIGSKSEDDLRRAIRDGLAGTPMTGFGQLLSSRELDSILEFVRSLAIATVASPDQSPAPMPASLVDNLKVAGFVPDARWRTAPPLEVRAVDGKTVSIESLRGSLVLVVFWGTSCSSCVSELPDLEQLAVSYRDAGLRVLPVCLDQTKAVEAHTVAMGHAKNLPVYVDPDGFARLRYDVQGLPTAVLIDRDGRMLGAANGARNWADPHVHALITSCLAGL